jgi:tRNA pseudouridine55 synthase
MTSNSGKRVVNGWLLIDKPKGLTSAAVVGKVKRLLKCKKVGHAGTLDPLASGVLPLALGEATKVVSYAMSDHKQYRFTVQWGEATTTDDSEGEVCATSSNIPSKEAVEKVLPDFIGTIQQVPPRYSAIKVKGRRAYDLARKDVDFTLEARSIDIFDLKLEEYNESTATFVVSCGKGTYVRSLARDIAHALKTEAHIVELIRLSVGQFVKKDAILLENLEEYVYKGTTSDWLRPLEMVLDDIPVLSLTSEEARAITHGQQLPNTKQCGLGRVVLFLENVPIALADIYEDRIKPVRVFNL